MDAERIEVLHVADGDTVVVTVAHHLVFYLLPSLQTLLHKHLRRERECFLGKLVQLLLIVGKTRTESAKGVCSTDNHRIAQFGSSLTGLFDILASLALDSLHVYLVELLHEELAVFGVHDCLHWCAENLHIVLLEHSCLEEFHTTVERGLTSEGEEDAVGALLLDDSLNEIRLHGQEVNLVGNALGCLHRGNVRIDENRLDALFAKSFQSLRTRIVKLTGFTDFQCA